MFEVGKMAKKQLIIQADLLFDGLKCKENQRIVVEGNKIVEVKSGKGKADVFGVVTPAFIDPHSHIGMDREGEPSGEGDEKPPQDDAVGAVTSSSTKGVQSGFIEL